MSLPLPLDELPEKIRRFGAPDAPVPAKTMAAKGLVPVQGGDMVTLLVQLSADADQGVRSAATQTLAGMPEGVLDGALRGSLHPAILDGLVEHVRNRDALLESLAANRATPDATIAKIARFANDPVCERIATDQTRLLGHPEIIEALYKNINTRMSTVDRLVELAARHGVELKGVETFQAHVEAIRGELIVDEATDEPLEEDLLFRDAVADKDADAAVDAAAEDELEAWLNDPKVPLRMKVAKMKLPHKLRLANVGGAAARALLVRDPLKSVAMAAIQSPSMTESEAAKLAISKEIGEDILRYIGNRRDWLGNYEVKRNLLFNPKTPMGISMKFLSHLRANDLKSLAKSKGVAAALRSAAMQRIEKQDKKRG